MSTTQTLILGAIAGFTIFLGLPVGRMRNLSPRVGAALNAVATGILIFLFWDVISAGVEPVESHLEAHSWGAFIGYAALMAGGVAAGGIRLGFYLRWLEAKPSAPLLRRG